jgi:hypothetical protein
MEQQYQQQPQQQMEQQYQQQPQQQMGQQPQSFDQAVPQQVSQAIYQLEQFETDAEWAHGQAMKAGDRVTSGKLADISQIVHLQKTLLLRESDLAQSMSQCTQQALQQSTQQLQQSQIPGVQRVVQQVQQVSETISQASAQVAQRSQTQQMGGRVAGHAQSPQFGSQSFY